MFDWQVHWVGDSAVAIETDQRIDPAINDQALAIGAAIRRAAHPGVRDVIESYAGVTVEFDPLRTDVARLVGDLESAAAAGDLPAVRGRDHRVPVCYGGPCGPDLAAVAAFAGCRETEVIERHVEPTYRVFMLGFLPGFAYMGSVDATIAMPRRASPRLRVPAGSVGIAGRQTGVYPQAAPGGWQLIGRTPISIVDRAGEGRRLLAPADQVRFEPISMDVFERLAGRA